MFFQVVFIALLALLPMVNPPTTATLLLGLSKGMSREHIRRQINLAAIYLFATLCVSFFIGSSILDLFGISIPGLRLAGGLIIAFIGFRMLFPAPSQSAGVDINQSIAFVPLTMPSMCGPGTMALVISGAAQIAELPDEYNRFVIYAAMVTAFALINDVEHRATFVLDRRLAEAERVNFHPMTNTATTGVSQAGFAKFLQALGITHIHGNDGTSPWCTVTNASRFFSHRRDSGALGASGRFAACIWRS